MGQVPSCEHPFAIVSEGSGNNCACMGEISVLLDFEHSPPPSTLYLNILLCGSTTSVKYQLLSCIGTRIFILWEITDLFTDLGQKTRLTLEGK